MCTGIPNSWPSLKDSPNGRLTAFLSAIGPVPRQGDESSLTELDTG